MTANFEKTLKEIARQQERLDQKKLSARQEALQTVRAIIDMFQFKASEIGFDSAKRADVAQVKPAAIKLNKLKSKSARKVEPKYCAPDGKLWTGRGKQPKSIREALEAGFTLEDMLIEKKPAEPVSEPVAG